MKTVKKIAIGLAVFLGLVMITGLFLPGKLSVERSVEIQAPVDTVFDLVGNMQNWYKWSPWHQIDPKMKVEYFGNNMEKGSGYKWFSEHENVGNGTLTITSINPNKQIDTEMDFGGNGGGKASFFFDNKPESSKVTWTLDTDMKEGPWFMKIAGGYFKLMFKGVMENDYDKGLANLKAAAEKK